MSKVVHTEQAPAALGPYSQAVTSGNLVFTSGQIPLNPQTGEVAGTKIREQAEQVMKNLGAVLRAAGGDFSSVIKSTCFLANMADFADFNEVYGKYFTGKPARSCVAVNDLPRGVLVEVEAVAEIAYSNFKKQAEK